jgi:ABC-2 type transport system ATP-binding protein
MDLAIETFNLTKRYRTLTAVDRLNLKVEKGTVHGFLGPNGAGKTTTIKVLVGLLRPDEGKVKVLGREVFGDTPQARLKVGYMPELPKFPKHLRGWELLDIYGQMYGMDKKERLEQIPKLLELVGLRGREKDYVGKYSKGMQQRLGIAQALLNNPELVILDEPSLGLDPVGMVEVRELVKNIAKENRTVFLSSHLLFEVEQVCSYVTIIHKGKSLLSDKLENVSNRLSGTATLNLELAEKSEAAVEALKRLPYVQAVVVEGKTLIVELKTRDDVRAQISKEITRAGGVIVSMSLKGQTLEDVFMQLITKPKDVNV